LPPAEWKQQAAPVACAFVVNAYFTAVVHAMYSSYQFFLIITATQLSAEELGNQEAIMCAWLFFFTSTLLLFARVKPGME